MLKAVILVILSSTGCVTYVGSCSLACSKSGVVMKSYDDVRGKCVCGKTRTRATR